MWQPKPARRHVQREAVFQAVANKFVRAVVLPPMWTTGINHENELTENARARAKARGVESGVFNSYVCQSPGLSCFIEYKWGGNKPSDAQMHVAQKLALCLIPRGFAWSMYDVLHHLRHAGFALHANAERWVVEYQAHAEAAVAQAELRAEAKADRPRAPGVPRRRTTKYKGDVSRKVLGLG